MHLTGQQVESELARGYLLLRHLWIRDSGVGGRSYCGASTAIFDAIAENRRPQHGDYCRVCYWSEQSEWEDMQVSEVTLNEADRLSGDTATFDTEKYRQLFNGFLKDPTKLAYGTEKPVHEMDNEELTKHIYELETFIKVAKVAKQAARVTLEDRKLQMTEEQKKKQRELDMQYKPQVRPAESDKPKRAKSASKKMTEEEKKIKAAMDLMGLTEEKAIEWLKSKGRI